MITNFPIPLKNELLYSVFARYHVNSGNMSYKATMEDLFGNRNVTATVELPAHLDNLIKRLPQLHQHTAFELVLGHTHYNFYTAFLSQVRTNNTLDRMKSSHGGSLYGGTGLMASSIKLPEYFKFCPACAADSKKGGNVVWNRLHQLPGVFICSQHEIALHQTSVRIRGANKQAFIAASESIFSTAFEVQFPNGITEHLLNLSKDISALIEFNLERSELDWLKKEYVDLLIINGYANINRMVKMRKLIKDFTTFYGNEFLKVLNSQIDPNASTNWFTDLFHTNSRTTHPLRHLLVLRFLGSNVEDFFKPKIEEKTDGLWPCLNKVAEHFGDRTAKLIKMKYSPEIKKTISHFKCECGFSYSRAEGIPEEEYSQILEFGHVWENKLQEVSLTDASLRKKAKVMHCDPMTFKKYFKAYHNMECNKSCDIDRLDIIKIKRGEWMGYQDQNPCYSLKQLRYEYPGLFSFLYRCDKDWLTSNSPVKKKDKSSRAVDWNERDRVISEMLLPLLEELKNNEGKPVFINRSQLGYLINKRSLIHRHLKKLPLTGYLLENECLSRAEYRTLRIAWAKTVITEQYDFEDVWRILRLAGIRSEFLYELDGKYEKNK